MTLGRVSSRRAVGLAPAAGLRSGLVALGQAGFALRSRDEFVLIDPFLSPSPNRLIEAVVDPRGLARRGPSSSRRTSMATTSICRRGR